MLKGHWTNTICKRWSCFRKGLSHLRVGEMVEFVGKDLFGMALNLEKDVLVLLSLEMMYYSTR